MEGLWTREPTGNPRRISLLFASREADFLHARPHELGLHGPANMGSGEAVARWSPYRAGAGRQAVLDAHGGRYQEVVGQGSAFCSASEKGPLQSTEIRRTDAPHDVLWVRGPVHCHHPPRHQHLFTLQVPQGRVLPDLRDHLRLPRSPPLLRPPLGYRPAAQNEGANLTRQSRCRNLGPAARHHGQRVLPRGRPNRLRSASVGYLVMGWLCPGPTTGPLRSARIQAGLVVPRCVGSCVLLHHSQASNSAYSARDFQRGWLAGHANGQAPNHPNGRSRADRADRREARQRLFSLAPDVAGRLHGMRPLHRSLSSVERGQDSESQKDRAGPEGRDGERSRGGFGPQSRGFVPMHDV